MLLPREYYLTTDVLALAPDLLGKLLVVSSENEQVSGMIVETEAYRAPEDRASHAFGNRLTPRTRTMFLEGGHTYVYVCYGIHDLFNVVTGPEGIPHAILIRAIQPVRGIESMALRRNRAISDPEIGKGPGCLTQALGIQRKHNALRLYDPESPVQIHDVGHRIPAEQLGTSHRIGVESSGESALLPWRYYIRKNPYVSGGIHQ